jgi:hypothetical protein
VVEQLEQKGWRIEVLGGDGDDPVQIVISSPAVRTAAPPQPAARQNTNAEQMADDNLRKWMELERAEQRGDGPSSEVTFTASKKAIVWTVIVIAAIATFAAVWFLYLQPRRELDELAKRTCMDLDGSMMLFVPPKLTSAVDDAERLGFTGEELGDRMREHCPSIIQQIQRWAMEY